MEAKPFHEVLLSMKVVRQREPIVMFKNYIMYNFIPIIKNFFFFGGGTYIFSNSFCRSRILITFYFLMTQLLIKRNLKKFSEGHLPSRGYDRGPI